MDDKAQLDITLDAAAAASAADLERQDLLAKIATLEQRITDLESSTVLSEPETRVRRVEVFVDPAAASTTNPCRAQAGDHLSPRAHVSPADDQREDRRRARGRRQERVTVGVDAAMATQFAKRTRGDSFPATGLCAGVGRFVLHRRHRPEHAVFRRHRRPERRAARQPDSDADARERLHGAAVSQNSLNLREAWLRTEV